jgi:hypothetical protein
MATTSFATDIRPLFRDDPDVAHMQPQGIDLSSYDDVKNNADLIYGTLNGTPFLMPPANAGGPWPAEQIALFKRWIDEGCQP